jgi:tRNA pseudouridine-54 N-methylase
LHFEEVYMAAIQGTALRAAREGNIWRVLAGVSDAVVYEGFEQLPGEMQRHLSLLLMLRPGQRMEGVGRRVSEDVFWVFRERTADEWEGGLNNGAGFGTVTNGL